MEPLDRRTKLLLGEEFLVELRALQARTFPPEPPAPVAQVSPTAFSRPPGVSDEEFDRALVIVSRQGITEVDEVSDELWAKALDQADVEIQLEHVDEPEGSMETWTVSTPPRPLQPMPDFRAMAEARAEAVAETIVRAEAEDPSQPFQPSEGPEVVRPLTLEGTP